MSDHATPMIAQFLDIKRDYPNCLLFYRMGDFYEMFFDDAVVAAEVLNITLTKRGKHQGKDIQMCGVPHHAADGYLRTLINKGFYVAICEQLDSPTDLAGKGGRGLMQRGVVRLITPGTITEEALLDARHHNYLCALNNINDDFAVSWVDVSTGAFHVQATPRVALSPLLTRLNPKEILIPSAIDTPLREMLTDTGYTLTELAVSSFDTTGGESRLKTQFKVKSLDGFGQFGAPEISVMGAIVDYLAITQKGQAPLLFPPVLERIDKEMQIDGATRRNLEITHNLSGGRDLTLLRTMDRTITSAGARALEARLSAPSTDINKINRRLDAIGWFIDNAAVQATIKDVLRQTPDMERALARICLGRGGPRDLDAIRAGLARGDEMAKILSEAGQSDSIAKSVLALRGHEKLIKDLDTALMDNPPVVTRDGEFIKGGFHAELDEARELRDNGRRVITRLQIDYADHTGITSLKIKHNRVLGYFVETPSSHANKMLGEGFSDTYIHRQTTVNSVRFTTVELSELENRILNATSGALEIEKQLFADLCGQIIDYAVEISLAASALARVDVSVALADIAVEKNWTRPALSTDRAFNIIGGRHPVVEGALSRSAGEAFIANDCDLSADGKNAKPIWLLTGPNMAGKSTFLRQNALLALMAQMGSYVPAESAQIGIVGHLFSRVGASDDLARGRSTFMVEMVETAAILNQAGKDALVILDEIGRGTATYDGLSIAWATLEHLHGVNQCRTLFATHYHELTGLSEQLAGVKNATVRVREWQGDIIFLHEIVQGQADRSYGVQVAKLAGLPSSVIERASVLLDQFNTAPSPLKGAGSKGGAKTAPPESMNVSVKKSAFEAEAKKILDGVAPDSLSPREALDLVYRLVKTIND